MRHSRPGKPVMHNLTENLQSFVIQQRQMIAQ